MGGAAVRARTARSRVSRESRGPRHRTPLTQRPDSASFRLVTELTERADFPRSFSSRLRLLCSPPPRHEAAAAPSPFPSPAGPPHRPPGPPPHPRRRSLTVPDSTALCPPSCCSSVSVCEDATAPHASQSAVLTPLHRPQDRAHGFQLRQCELCLPALLLRSSVFSASQRTETRQFVGTGPVVTACLVPSRQTEVLAKSVPRLRIVP